MANYTYLDTRVNKAIGDDAPNAYFGKVLEQCAQKSNAFGNIFAQAALKENLRENAILDGVMEMTVEDYDEFLVERRKMMAQLVERYYKAL